MSKTLKVLLIVIPIIFILNFLTLANGQFTQSPYLQKTGDFIGFASLISFIILIIYLVFKKIIGKFRPPQNKIETQRQTLTGTGKPVIKESNRRFNLIWLILFGFFIVLNLYCASVVKSDYLSTPVVSSAAGFIICLMLIISRRNNLFILIPLLIISIMANSTGTRFYDFTWFLYPNLNSFAVSSGITTKWLMAGLWGISFLAVTAGVYIFLSSFSRLFFKKTWAKKCFLISLFITGLASCILFNFQKFTFTFSQNEIKEIFDSKATVQVLDAPDPVNAKHIISIQSASPFFIYATDLSKGKRYGVRILTPEQKAYKEEGIFFPCRKSNCELDFGGWNNIGDRFEPGIYTIQIIAQEGKELTIAAKAKIEITKLIIGSYNENADYPCKMWLTLGNSSEKLMRIDEMDSQKMITVGVYVQCQKDQTYNAQVSVGTLDNKTEYYSSVIDYTGEPVRVVSLGGNTSHGLVQLFINNQIMGEAIINRGFPICDNVGGGEDSKCQ